VQQDRVDVTDADRRLIRPSWRESHDSVRHLRRGARCRRARAQDCRFKSCQGSRKGGDGRDEHAVVREQFLQGHLNLVQSLLVLTRLLWGPLLEPKTGPHWSSDTLLQEGDIKDRIDSTAIGGGMLTEPLAERPPRAPCRVAQITGTMLTGQR